LLESVRKGPGSIVLTRTFGRVNVLDAMRRQRPYVFTDDHATEAVDARMHAIIAARDDALGGLDIPHDR